MLNDAVARMERYYAQNNTYKANDLTALGYASAAPASPSNRYALNLTTTATTYSLTASPIGQQNQDACGALVIDQAGAKKSTGGTDCFK
jgi:type IV pilus assembly protein PilE